MSVFVNNRVVENISPRMGRNGRISKPMIDWYFVFSNALWIFALALALATISFARWQAFQEGQKLGQVLDRANWQIPMNISGLVFCLGLAATSARLWERVLWLVMVLLFGIQTWIAVRKPRN